MPICLSSICSNVYGLQCQKERDKEVSDDEADAETEDKKEDEAGDSAVSIGSSLNFFLVESTTITILTIPLLSCDVRAVNYE